MKTRAVAVVAFVAIMLAARAALPARSACASTGVWGPGWLKKMFLDEDEAPWAAGQMAKMKAKGLVSGYADGRYRPNAMVSRAEVVTAAVKLIGAADEAASRAGRSLPFEDDELIRSDCAWAVGYISTALNHDIVDSTTVEFGANRPATRLWTAEVFARAMGLKSAAQSKMSALLGYADRSLIPANKVGYVAVMKDRGIMTASGNYFRPNNALTRAELAVILDRCDEWIAPRESSELRGVISSIDEEDRKVTVRLYDREWWSGGREDVGESELFSGNATLEVSPLALVLVDNEYADVGDLETGWRVVLIESDDAAVVIDASSGEIAGWPGSADIGDDEQDDEEDQDEEEDDDGDEDEDDEEEENDDEDDEAQLVAGTVKAIEVEDYREITIRDLDGRARTYGIADDCDVRLASGRQSYVEDIRVNDKVTLEIESGEVVKVTFGILEEAVSEDEVVTGTVVSVKAGNNSLIIRTDDGSTQAVIVNEDAGIKRNGQSVSLGALREDDYVEIGMEDWEAVRIEASSSSSSDYTGEVTRLTLDASPRKITIKPSGGSSKTLELGSSVTVEFEDLPLDVEDILVGDTVSLKMSGSRVREITIKERETDDVLGEVVSVALDDGYYRLRLRTSSGTKTYSMIPGVVIKKGSDSLKPRDLEEDASVVVRVAGDAVTKVTIVD